jgi:hypothetical protein
MTATLTFDIPEERELHIRAIYGMDYRGLIADLDNECRMAIKHGHKHKSPEETLQWVRDFICEGLNDIHDIET